MTEHPMQCYKGQFEPWMPNSYVLRADYIAGEDVSMDYDGLERCGVSHAQIIAHSQTAINRMMSGQITKASDEDKR